jgi:hypothetical protein
MHASWTTTRSQNLFSCRAAWLFQFFLCYTKKKSNSNQIIFNCGCIIYV